MPTYNRRLFISQAVTYFLRQDYSDKELIIVDDGPDKIADLIPYDERIKYIPLEQKSTIGYKRNLAVKQSNGEIIAHWDDDDWYHPSYLNTLVQKLLESGQKEAISGISAFLICFPKESTQNLKQYRFGGITGATFCYYKTLWEKHPYRDITIAEDYFFIKDANPRILPVDNPELFIIIRHDNNTWQQERGTDVNDNLKRLRSYSRTFEKIINHEDYQFYERIRCNIFKAPPKSMEVKMETWENETADVSIGVIVQGNEECDNLRRALNGIYKNTGYPFKLFILDAGAPGCAQWLDNSQYKNIKRIIAADKGKPHVFNRFIEETTTPYLAILESTAYVTEGWLTLLVDCLKSHPGYGIAGPSTSRCWNEQQVVKENHDNGSLSEIETFGIQVKQRYGNKIQELSQLHSINDFCYILKREIVEKTGYFDEAYGRGPCFEIDYNTRAARAGYRCVWVCGAYVHRFPQEENLKIMEDKFFAANKQLYQKKFCDLQFQGKRQTFCVHCHGEACQHFDSSPSILLTGKTNKNNEEPPGKSCDKPMISCIMPTYNRRLFVSQAIMYFLQQDYPNKELIIVDDGTDKIEDLVTGNEQLKYLRIEQKKSIGYKRNLAVGHSLGEIIAHWDDDDWYGKERLSYQAQPLLDGKADVCGIDMGIIYNINENTFWSCDPSVFMPKCFMRIFTAAQSCT